MNKYKVYLVLESTTLNILGYLGYGWFTTEAASPEEAIEHYAIVNTKSYDAALRELNKPHFMLAAPNSLAVHVVPQQQFQFSIWKYHIRAELDETNPS